MKKTDSFRVLEHGDQTVIDGFFLAETSEEIDLKIKQLRILQPLLRQATSRAFAVQGGEGAVNALCPQA